MFSERDIDEFIARKRPENLLFCRTSRLLGIALETDCYSDEIRIRCIGELIVRWFLSRREELAKEIAKVLPNGEIEDLALLLLGQSVYTERNIQGELWCSSDIFSKKCETEVRHRFRELLGETDGFIPVYSTAQQDFGFFIPFHFEEAGKQPLVADAAGNPCPEWIPHYRAIIPEYRCVLHCWLQEDLPAFTGNSLQLPLLLAYWRKKELIPSYNPLRLLATGAIEQNRLNAVEVQGKLSALKQTFPDAFFLIPGNSRFYTEEQNIILLNSGIDMSTLQVDIQKIIEQKALAVPDLSYALRCLPKIETEVREENYRQWQTILDRLNTLGLPFAPDRNPREYLLFLMLKSAALCHMGKPAEAIVQNHIARKFASLRGFEKEFLRLEVEELVELQDQEYFSDISQLFTDLGERLETQNDIDLLMRFHGTMGQVHSYGTILCLDGFDKESALAHFYKALNHAIELDSEVDIAQDRNYLHLWHALFAPCTGEEEDAFKLAWDHIKCNLQKTPMAQRKNYYYLKRQKALALYRFGRQTGTAPDYDLEMLYLPHQDAEDWLCASSDKYLGALLAASGDIEKALKCFEDAASILPVANCSRLKAFIRMTVLAQAFRSLSEAGCLELAATFRVLALKEFSLHHEFDGFVRAADWKSVLSEAADSIPLPDYYY